MPAPASIHPEVELHLIIDQQRFDEEASAEVERRFSEAAPAVAERARKGSARTDVLEFRIAEDPADESGDPLWHGAFATWLADLFDQVSGLIARENQARANDGRPELAFSHAEVHFGEGPAISLALADGAIPPEAAGFVERARELVADRAFGEGVCRVSIPGCAVETDVVASERAAAVENDTGVAAFAVGGPGSADAGGSSEEVLAVKLGVQAAGNADRAEGERAEGERAAEAEDADTAELAQAAVSAQGTTEAERGAQGERFPGEPDTLGGPGFASDARKRDEPSCEDIEAAVQQAEDALRGEAGPPPSGADVPSVRTEPAPATDAADALEPTRYAPGVCTPDARIWDVDYQDGTRLRYDSILAEVIPVR